LPQVHKRISTVRPEIDPGSAGILTCWARSAVLVRSEASLFQPSWPL